MQSQQQLNQFKFGIGDSFKGLFAILRPGLEITLIAKEKIHASATVTLNSVSGNRAIFDKECLLMVDHLDDKITKITASFPFSLPAFIIINKNQPALTSSPSPISLLRLPSFSESSMSSTPSTSFQMFSMPLSSSTSFPMSTSSASLPLFPNVAPPHEFLSQTAPSQPAQTDQLADTDISNKKRRLDDTYKLYIKESMDSIDVEKEKEKKQFVEEINNKSIDFKDPNVAELCNLIEIEVKNNMEKALDIENNEGITFTIPEEYQNIKLVVAAAIELAKIDICMFADRHTWDVQLFYVVPKQ